MRVSVFVPMSAFGANGRTCLRIEPASVCGSSTWDVVQSAPADPRVRLLAGRRLDLDEHASSGVTRDPQGAPDQLGTFLHAA